MTKLHCSVENCANNKENFCCRPDIMVGGPDSEDAAQTYCANFLERSDNLPEDAVDSDSPNSSLDVHCEVANCIYNEDRACEARHVDIKKTRVNDGQEKTECSTFRTEE